MNSNHLQQIFKNYIERFEQINNPEHEEYYKWQIAKRFRGEMDAALDAPDAELPARLYEVKKLSENLIDSYTQPFYGLVKFAEKEPGTVRRMFRDLYSDDGGDILKRQKRVRDFLTQSHVLRDKCCPDSYLYKDDMHSVTGYLFLYDPDNNYIYKATNAQIFADCAEFYDDWGSGDMVKLDVYYRMCDELVAAIKNSKELMTTDAGRFENGWGVDPDTLYADPEKHVLAFDLIYCCYAYSLFDGITFVRPNTKERLLMQDRKTKALQLSKKAEEAKEKFQKLEDAKAYVNSVYDAGVTVHHKTYGDGVIKNNNGTSITVAFPKAGEKKLGTFISAANGVISADAEDYSVKMELYKAVLKEESYIKTALSYAEREFAPYAEYLE